MSDREPTFREIITLLRKCEAAQQSVAEQPTVFALAADAIERMLADQLYRLRLAAIKAVNALCETIERHEDDFADAATGDTARIEWLAKNPVKTEWSEQVGHAVSGGGLVGHGPTFRKALDGLIRQIEEAT